MPSPQEWFLQHRRPLIYNLHCVWMCITGIIIYPSFASTDTEIYPHAAVQYHAWPKAKCGIALFSVDKFPYLRKQTTSNEFIPCSNDVCHFLKRFHSNKILVIPLICPKFRINIASLGRIAAARKGKWTAVRITIVTSSMTSLFISYPDHVKR